MATNKKPKSDIAKIFLRSLIVVLLGAISVTGFVIYLAQDLPSLEQLENYDPDLVTRIYSSDGQILDELFVQKRVFVELKDIPAHMRHAVVASEDKRFYDHWGISLRSVFRAVVVNIVSFDPYAQGFSSLTQQLARSYIKPLDLRIVIHVK